MNSESMLMLEALRASMDNRKVTWETAIPAQTWQALFALAEAHRVLPLVYEAVFDCPAAQRAGQSIFAPFKSRALQAVYLQTTKTAEFLRLYQHLQAAGAAPLVVKGIICRDLYPRPDLRMSSDEDLLIPPEQFPRYHQAMLDFGMVPAANTQDFQNAYEVPYRKPNNPLYIELHKSLFPPDSDACGSFNRFFADVDQRAVHVSIQNVPLAVMNSTDHLFYLICHAFKHFLYSGFGIRQVCDITLFANAYGAEINWNLIWENCKALRAERFTAALFQIGQKHLTLNPEQAHLSENWRRIEVDEAPLLEDLLASGIYGSSSLDRLHSSNITLHAAAGAKTGHSVLRTVFPSAKSLAGRYPYLQQHPYLLPVAWAERALKYCTETRQTPSGGAMESVQIGRQRVALLKAYGIID